MQDPKANKITIISPFSEPSSWFPEPYQILRYPNENKKNSLWLGLVAPLVMLPGRLWNEVLRPAFNGHVGFAIKHLLVGIPLTSALWVRWGVSGNAYAVKATPEQLQNARFLLPHESLIAMVNGFPQVAEVNK